MMEWAWSRVKILSLVVMLQAAMGGIASEYMSAVGDPGMRRDGLRVAFEGWNFCNEVGQEAPAMGSPRAADCFELQGGCKEADGAVTHLVSEQENRMGVGASGENADLYAVKKEIYLGGKCQVHDKPDGKPWQFWMIMLKNGNFDTKSALCPANGKKVGPFPSESRFPCFATGKCMNQPLMFHNYTAFSGDVLRGSFFGTYELDADITKGLNNISYYSVAWEKKFDGGDDGGWKFHHYLKTSKKYPWLMLYLRSDATDGLSGGYHYPGRGMTTIIPESPDFKVRMSLNVKQGGGPKSQFYLTDIGGCWKNDGEACDGNVHSDVTRYSEMILNPDTQSWCSEASPGNCPPFHGLPNGTRIHRSDANRFPYAAYHMYCAPGNAEHLEEPYNMCDAYSNPQPQEIVQIVPHPAWGVYGYPTKKGEGWVGDPREWELDVGGMSQVLYFYQDPGTSPAKRRWTSVDVGTEIYVSGDRVAEWTLSGFDILLPKKEAKFLGPDSVFKFR